MSVGEDYHMREPKIYFVTHPMKEPPYKSAPAGTRISIPWNTTTKHRRKCIKRHGCYLKDGNRIESDLYFWGEYEASIEPLNEAYKHAGILDKDGNIKKKDFFFKGQSHLENNNLYSFVPCKLDASPQLKDIPCLDLKKFGTTNHRAVTYTKERWNMICKAVEKRKWQFGVYIEKV